MTSMTTATAATAATTLGTERRGRIPGTAPSRRLWSTRRSVAVVALVVATGVVVALQSGGDGNGAVRTWSRAHVGELRSMLTAVDAVPTDPRAHSPADMSAACARVLAVASGMRAASPAPAPRLARVWTSAADDFTTVAGFCVDAAARRDAAMLDEVPNYFALADRHLDDTRRLIASYGSPL